MNTPLQETVSILKEMLIKSQGGKDALDLSERVGHLEKALGLLSDARNVNVSARAKQAQGGGWSASAKQGIARSEDWCASAKGGLECVQRRTGA
jgi:hypothetical protein